MSAIKLYSITSRDTTSGEITKTSVVPSVSKTTTAKSGQIKVGALKSISKSKYTDLTTGVIKTDTSNWVTTGTVSQYDKRTTWKTRRFKKYTGSGNNRKYYYWDVQYYYCYETRVLSSTYNFTVQPVSMNVTLQDLDVEDENAGTDVGRNKKGVIVRNRVRTNVRTVECEFPPLTQAEVAEMMPYITNEGGQGYMKLTYDDPYEGKITINCYAGDRSFEAGHFGKWLHFKVTFVEV